MDSGSKHPSATVEIYDIKTEKDVTRYCLRVTLESSSGKIVWSVLRRFREFLVLDSSLRKVFRSDTLLPLPPKTVFKCFEENFLADRKVTLQRYLDAIMKVPYLQNSPQLRTFLQINENTEQPIAPTQILTSYPNNLWDVPQAGARSSFDFFYAAIPSKEDFLFTVSADRSSVGKKKRFGFCSSCITTTSGVIQVWRQVDTAMFRRPTKVYHQWKSGTKKDLPNEPELNSHLLKNWSSRKPSAGSSAWSPRTVNYKEDMDDDSEEKWDAPLTTRKIVSTGNLGERTTTATAPSSQKIAPILKRQMQSSTLDTLPLSTSPVSPPNVGKSRTEEKYSVEMLPSKPRNESPKPALLRPVHTMLTHYQPSCLCYHAEVRQLYVGTGDGGIHRYNLVAGKVGKLSLVPSGTLPSPHECMVHVMEIWEDYIFVACDGLQVSCMSIKNFTVLTRFNVMSEVRSILVHNGHIFLSFEQEKNVGLRGKLEKLPVLCPDLIDDLKEEETPVVKNRMLLRARSYDKLSAPVMVGYMCMNSHTKHLFCADKCIISVWILEAGSARLTKKWREPTGLIKEITALCTLPEYKALCLGGDTGFINFFSEDGECICAYQAATQAIRYLKWMPKTLQIAVMTASTMWLLSVPPVLFNYHALPKHEQELTLTSNFFDNVITSKLLFTGQGLQRQMSEDSVALGRKSEGKFDLRWHNSLLRKSRLSKQAMNTGQRRSKEKASVSYGVGKHMYTISCITVDTADDLSYYSEDVEANESERTGKQSPHTTSYEDKGFIEEVSFGSVSRTSTRCRKSNVKQ